MTRKRWLLVLGLAALLSGAGFVAPRPKGRACA